MFNSRRRVRRIVGPCAACRGNGMVDHGGYESRAEECDECYGSGYLYVVASCALSCKASKEERSIMGRRLRVLASGQNVKPGALKKSCCECPLLNRSQS